MPSGHLEIGEHKHDDEVEGDAEDVVNGGPHLFGYVPIYIETQYA